MNLPTCFDEEPFIFIGEGGTGKTTSLLRIWEDWLKTNKELPLYVPLNEYNNEKQEDSFISSYIKRNYCIDLSTMYVPVILLLDGFNEISKTPDVVIHEIRKLSVRVKTRIVITSRQDFVTRYGLEGFENYKLQPLSPKRIRAFWKSVKTSNTNLRNVNLPKKWQTLLSNPMMLTLFAKTCAAQKNAEKSGWFSFKHARTKGELIYNYLLCQLTKPVADNRWSDLYCTYIALFWVAPYVAWRMEENNGLFYVNMDECEQQITEYLDSPKNKFCIQLATTKFLKKIARTFCFKWEETAFDPLDVLVNQFYLLTEENDRYLFQHQYFRDFFSALHIDNSLERSFAELTEEKAFCIPEEIKDHELSPYVADMLGGYYGDYQNQKSCIVKNDNLHKLLEHLRGLDYNQAGFAINNIICVWRTSRKDQIVDENLFKLDLTNVRLNNICFSTPTTKPTCFDESIISDITFLPHGHSAGIKSAVYSKDESCILTASYDGTVREWDRNDPKKYRVFEGHDNGVESAVYSEDGCILTASWDGTVREWDRQTGECLRIFKGHGKGVGTAIYSEDESCILSASRDGTVREWDRQTGECLRIFKGHGKGVTTAIYSEDESCILSASRDGTVREWNRQTGKCLRVFKDHDNVVTTAIYSEDGCILTASWDGTVREWDRNDSKKYRVFEGHTDFVYSAVYSKDESCILTASYDGTVREWDRNDPKKYRVFEGHTDFVYSAVYSKDGLCILSASGDGTVREWDRNDPEKYRSFKGHAGFVYSAVYNSNGTRILSASGDGTVREWDRKKRNCIIWSTPPYGGVFIVGCTFKGCDFGGNEKIEQLIRRYGGRV